jgi:hypothetical protein
MNARRRSGESTLAQPSWRYPDAIRQACKLIMRRLSAFRTVAPGVLLASIVAASFAGSARSSTAATPIGSASGIALFARMQAGYAHAAAVELTVLSRGSRHRVFGHFVLKLHRGIVVAERFVAPGAVPVDLVASMDSSTYLRQPSRGCWRRLPSSDPRTLEDVGLPFPYGRLPGKAMVPKRNGNTWTLPTENRENFWYLATQNAYKPTAKRFVVYTVDAESRQIRSIEVQALKNGTMEVHAQDHPPTAWWTAHLSATTLTSAPRLPAPTPTC